MAGIGLGVRRVNMGTGSCFPLSMPMFAAEAGAGFSGAWGAAQQVCSPALQQLRHSAAAGVVHPAKPFTGATAIPQKIAKTRSNRAAMAVHRASDSHRRTSNGD